MIIWSGGQTGVDRAAWDAAPACGLEQDGWVPKGRLAEDGRIPDRYRCRETDSTEYSDRTEKNLREADFTLILAFGELTGGTLYTKQLCLRYHRPHVVVDLDKSDEQDALRDTAILLGNRKIQTLNVAGPRASFQPDVYDRAFRFLSKLFSQIR